MKKATVLLALLLAFALLMSACGSPKSSGSSGTAPPPTAAPDGSGGTAPAPEPEAEPKTLTAGTLDAASTFDTTSAANCGLGLMLVYDSILHRNYETGEIEPMLAESWSYADDTTLVLNIRNDVYFSNGELMTPEDVLYTLWRFVYVNTQFETGYDVIDFDNCTIEGNTLTLKLTQTAPNFLNQLANDRWANVLCKSYVESSGEDAFWDKPVGTGPYVCLENTAGSQSVYERRDDYWGDMPEASTVTVRYYSELTTMMVDFENGVLDIALDVGNSDYGIAASGGYGDDVVAKLFPAYDVLAVTMPEYMAVFDDIRVRQAVALALDVTAITQAVYGELGTVAESNLIKGVDYWISIGVNEYDPERAKALLAEAGYEPGDITLLMLFPSMPANDKASTIIQSMLGEVGITVNVESGDFATVIPRLMNNECELSLYGTGGSTYTARDVYKSVGLSSTNAGARCSDEEFNKWLDIGNTSLDDAVRADAYAKAQQALAETYRFIPIAYSNSAILYHDKVDSVVGLVARGVNLRYVTFK